MNMLQELSYEGSPQEKPRTLVVYQLLCSYSNRQVRPREGLDPLDGYIQLDNDEQPGTGSALMRSLVHAKVIL